MSSLMSNLDWNEGAGFESYSDALESRFMSFCCLSFGLENDILSMIRMATPVAMAASIMAREALVNCNFEEERSGERMKAPRIPAAPARNM